MKKNTLKSKRRIKRYSSLTLILFLIPIISQASEKLNSELQIISIAKAISSQSAETYIDSLKKELEESDFDFYLESGQVPAWINGPNKKIERGGPAIEKVNKFVRQGKICSRQDTSWCLNVRLIQNQSRKNWVTASEEVMESHTQENKFEIQTHQDGWSTVWSTSNRSNSRIANCWADIQHSCVGVDPSEYGKCLDKNRGALSMNCLRSLSSPPVLIMTKEK